MPMAVGGDEAVVLTMTGSGWPIVYGGLLLLLARWRPCHYSRPRGVVGTYAVFDIRTICPGSYHRGCMRVLIVEDEPLLAEAIRDGLRLEAIAADIAGDGDTALELLSVNVYDIAVLDRDIPGPSGDEIAKRIVASGSGMPILMLTAADRLDDKASGFELGRRRLPHEALRTSRARAQAQSTQPQARPQQTTRSGDRRPASGSVPPGGLPRRPLRRAHPETVRRARGPRRGRRRCRQRRRAAGTSVG